MRKRIAEKIIGSLVLLNLSASVCLAHTSEDGTNAASLHTINSNEAIYDKLDFSNQQEFEFSRRGLIAAPENLELRDTNGRVIWSQAAYNFVEGQTAPNTVNPSLWRNVQMNHEYGLFKVIDGIYQVRGYDMANITFIAGQTGWIIFDPLMSTECSAAAMQLVEQHLDKRPIVAVIISHPHVDHFGGIKGIITDDDVRSGRIPLIVPAGFAEHAVSENVYAGKAMGRRAGYQYGTMLPANERGAMSIGIGMGQSKGQVSYITPSINITESGETMIIDGVEMEFQLTPDTEAPVEMNIYFPQKRALWLAENCTGTLHNLYTLRGAEVRDGNAWSKYIMEALTLYGDKTDVVFQAHNWPHWENDLIRNYMIDTAAVYKFINDQTLMYINQGYTSTEIANMIRLPDDLVGNWYTRSYYGTVSHNSKAVYQKYMGWYDANPIHLAELTPTDYAKKLVSYIGSDKILKQARRDYENGEYQWVAEITNAVVFAEPDNKMARQLCADALEQMAYQSESGTWRNAYLSGAMELRGKNLNPSANFAKGSVDLQANMMPEMMFDYMGIVLDSNAASDVNLKINIVLTDMQEQYVLTVKSGILLYQKGIQADDAVATLTMPREGLFAILEKNKAAQSKLIKITGDTRVIDKLTEHMVEFEKYYNIIEP